MEDLRLREGLIGVNVALCGLLEVKERSRLEGGRRRCGVRGECGILWGVALVTAGCYGRSDVGVCFC